MIIQEDSRQKAEKHANKHEYFKAKEITIMRSKLPYGDYALPPEVSVDTKQNITEIAQNMCGSVKEKRRFREECVLANSVGARLIILVEDSRITEVGDLFGRSIGLANGQIVSGDQLARTMSVMHERYGVEFEFCKPENTGKRIVELLTEKKQNDV